MLGYKGKEGTTMQIHIFYIMLVTTEQEKLVRSHGQKKSVTCPTNVSLTQL